MKKGILLVNLGTPEACSRSAISKYLREFLMDERVIDIPAWKRWLLVNLIIAPFRSPKVLKEYQKLWTDKGSPLRYHGEELSHKLQGILGNDYTVVFATRYQSPSIALGLDKLKSSGVESIKVIPLFPQYASATTGSVHQKVMELVKSWEIIPAISFMSSFYNEPHFLACFAQKVKPHLNKEQNPHLVFSYHGLPQRQMDKLANNGFCQGQQSKIYHYQQACFANSALIAKELGLEEEQYSTCFQSRLGKDPWIQPYTHQVIEQLAQKGTESIVVCSPSFLADCLETSIEIGEQYQELFLSQGGKHFVLVDSLNADDTWAAALAEMVKAAI